MSDADQPAPPAKSKRGFASMDPEKLKEIARRGGQSVKAESRSFTKNPELAAAAGQRGGTNRWIRAKAKAADPPQE